MTIASVLKCFVATLFLSLTAGSLSAQEPWAAKNLPVREGLALWLDAQVQPDAWKAHETRGQPLTDGRPFDIWFDGSGNRRHLIQRRPASQPTFRVLDEKAYVSFDGEDDFLASSVAGQKAQELTIFLFSAPQSNAGGFRAFLGASAFGRNDYVTGINIDQSYLLSPTFQTINVEGPGFGGARDLLAEDSPFRRFHLIEVIADAEAVRVIVGGKTPGQSRPRQKQVLSLEELILGARVYSNEPKPAFAQGFLHGEIAEVILYDRALDAEELVKVREYFEEKYQDLNEAVAAQDTAGGHLLESVKNPPEVQMLVPGFEVKKLPLELPNINNVLYRQDGKLVALGYNGDIFLLSDTDGDGLEDKTEVFWENRGRLQAPIGMDLTPPGYQHGQGVFVASKGKCSLIVDKDGDDRADEEIVIADGWEALGHGVDALGVAYDPKDGSVYFGLGTQNFANAYLPDRDGKPGYKLDGERGTILRVAPDFKSREIVCTGIRFPVSLRFHPGGDLFCTDQEGATWLPNGNPFDELLHIQKGRHYGFPPRHPKHLPNVIDEPSTFDYAPQHQSTCGMNFNEPAKHGRIFGPAWWKGDALITGYSRGKLYRTQLVKTKAGYVAQNHLVACLNKLTADACVSPSGDLVLATHSGGPDWGSGPAGEGTLYKILYSDREAAQPVLAWPVGAREVHVTFDRPLNLEDLKSLKEKIRIEHSPFAAAGDRFETVRPGYAVVQAQMATRRFELPVHGMQVTPDQRTLILNTDPHEKPDTYAITFPWKSRERAADENAKSLDQHAQIDLQYGLNGVASTLRSADGKTLWEGWLPHLDLQAAKELMRAGGAHEPLWNSGENSTADALVLRTQLDLTNMLRAQVQPGSELDFKYPPETVTLAFESNQKLQIRAQGAKLKSETTPEGRFAFRAEFASPSEDFIPLEITLPISRGEPLELSIAWRTAEDDRPRPLPLRRLFVPWAKNRKSAEEAPQIAQLPKELEGGSWGRGRKVFFCEKAQCGKCHRVGMDGGSIGPNLSNLIHRDYHSVTRDILQPSFAINPDHLTHTILLQDGRVLTGVVASAGDKWIVGDKEGKQIEIAPADVEEMKPSKVSIMPEGIAKELGPEGMRDLLTFLLTPPPRMPRDLEGAPEPRTLAEVEKILAGAEETKSPFKPIHIVLVAGRKDHGPGEHDYPAWLKVWGQLLEAGENVQVSQVMDWPSEQQLLSADALVFYQQGTWNEQRAADIDAFLKKGGGVSYIHYAVDGGKDPLGFADRIGLAWQGGGSKFRHGGLDLIFDSQHPIARNFRRVHFHDESYWSLKGDPGDVTVLASGREENSLQPLIWCREKHKGRVFVSIPGHYSWTFDDPLFRILLLRGIAWSAGESVDRFNPLITPGASLKQSP